MEEHGEMGEHEGRKDEFGDERLEQSGVFREVGRELHGQGEESNSRIKVNVAAGHAAPVWVH